MIYVVAAGATPSPIGWCRSRAAATAARLMAELPVRLREGLRGRDWRVRQAGVEGIGSLGDSGGMVVLAAAIQDEDAWVARAAVHSLAGLASTCGVLDQARLVLLRALSDERRQVAWSAAEELARHWIIDPEVGARLGRFYAEHGTEPPMLTFRHLGTDGAVLSEEPLWELYE